MTKQRFIEITNNSDLIIKSKLDCERGPFTITKLCGEGGFGAVVEVEDDIDKKPYAIKLLMP